VITKETALSFATNAPNLALRMSGISATTAEGKRFLEDQEKKEVKPKTEPTKSATPEKKSVSSNVPGNFQM